ncbi:MAG: hypothetical protein E7076_07015 [Bacteroidales bacterium]|nr:hypothetical protein [Bacteroidales bacterium]MBP5134680.1 hypothetical protein [Paludibacteraceae bacterium]MDD6356815.1 START-like domain-containing protein [Bacteroidales bacterium]
MAKEKVQLEYLFNKVSTASLWNSISTPDGLSDWFADSVSVDSEIFTFRWSKVEEEAELLAVRQMNSVRFRWLSEDDENSYFEMKIGSNPLTGDTSLTVVDFADNGEVNDVEDLWNSQIDKLKRKIGA